MTMSTTSKGHLREKVVEASVQTNRLIFNERDLSDQLQKENLVKKLSSEYNLNEAQIKLVKETINSKEWDEQSKSLTGFGQLVVMIIVTFMTAGAGTSIVGTAGAATTGTTTAATTTAATTTAATTTTATVQAAVVQSVVTGVANQLATSAITGESFKLDGESLLKGAISAGVMAYASDLIDGALEIDNVATSKMTTAEVFERSAANTVVRSGLNSVMYGTDFQDSLISGLKTDITNTGFHLAGDTALENTLEDGSLEKTLIHGVVGGGASELMGGEFAVGASSAAMNELLSPYTSIDEKERLIKGGRDREIELALSGFIGGATAYAVGGDEAVGTGEAIARSATEYNRQLHREEIKFINENAEKFAKEQGIDIHDAKARLAQQAMRGTDAVWNAVLGEEDTQAKEFLESKVDGQTFTNSRGEQQELFTTQNGDFYDPTRYANEAANADTGIYIVAQEKAKETLSNPELLKNRLEDKLIEEVENLPEKINAIAEDAKDKDFMELAQERLVDTATAVVDGLETGYGITNTSNETLDKIYGEGNSQTIDGVTYVLVTASVLGNGKKAKIESALKKTDSKIVELDGKLYGRNSSGDVVEVKKNVDLGVDSSNKGIYDSKEATKYFQDKDGAQNVAKVSKDSETGRQIVETTQGQKGGWNQTLNNPEPNTDYKFNDSVYKTDDLGRVQEASFSPSATSADRNLYQQSQAGQTGGIKDGLPNDQGGHINGAQNGGAGEQINYLPQDTVVNNGDYKKLENIWAQAAKNGDDVKVTVKPTYTGNSKRPDSFDVSYSINGEKSMPVNILNKSD
jgi:hypothetical protein